MLIHSQIIHLALYWYTLRALQYAQVEFAIGIKSWELILQRSGSVSESIQLGILLTTYYFSA